MDKKCKVVVITGASAGVGRALARKFAIEKACIGLIARGKEGLEATKKEVEKLGSKALTLPLDVAKANAVADAADKVEEEFGPIDYWINNAAVSVFSPIREMTPEEFHRVTEVNYLGAVHGTLAVLPRMLERNKGTIVMVGSALAYRGIPLQSAYSASKHAMQGFCDSLRAELLHEGSKVRVTMVQLPALNTTHFSMVKNRLPNKPKPLGDIYQPEVAAEAIHWAAHHPRRELVVGGSAVKTILENKVAPQFGDWMLAMNGFSGQQTAEADEPGRPDNLWEPVPGDHGAHGDFGEKASPYSTQLWLTTHRVLIGATCLGMIGGYLFVRSLLSRCEKNGNSRTEAASS